MSGRQPTPGAAGVGGTSCWRVQPMSCIGSALTTATWRSGYATVCKTVYPGSIPGVASNKIKNLYNPHILPSHCVSEPSAKSIPQFEQGSHRRRRHHVGVG